MSQEDTTTEQPESDVTSSMNFHDTELTLGLPGESRSSAVTQGKHCGKRGFIETVDLNLGSTTLTNKPIDNSSGKAQVIGWPPVRSYRKKELVQYSSSKLVKVAVDGAPYQRKVDLEIYGSYQELFKVLEDMFTCFTIRNGYTEEGEVMGKGMEYMPIYEDKDDDWMLVGDVPWKMFMESCKRIRLMKSSEAMGLARRTSTNFCSSTS